MPPGGRVLARFYRPGDGGFELFFAKSEYAPYLHSCEQGSPDKFSAVRNVNRVWFSLSWIR